MENPIFEDVPPQIILRTRDLILAENITLIAFVISIIWSLFFSTTMPLISVLLILIGPGLYTLFWRQRSIKHESSNPEQNLQSGLTIILFIWSLLECMIVLPTAFVLFIESIAEGFAFIKIFHIIPFLVTAIFTFYLLKTFSRSIKLDAKKPSI